MERNHVLVKYCSEIIELSRFLKKIHPDDIIAITERYGYTVVYKSNSEYVGDYKKERC